MPNDNLKKYYDYLKANNADVAPTYDAFANALSDENNAKKYHSYLINNGFDAPSDYNKFVNRLGLLKKKEVSQSTQENQDTSLDGSDKGEKKQSVSSSQQRNYSLPGEYLDYPGKGIRRYYDGKWYDYGFTETKNGKDLSVYNVQITDPTRVNTLNKKFNKVGSTSASEDVFTGYPGQEKNQYRVIEDQWQKKMPGSDKWRIVTNEGSIQSLNKEFNKNVSIPSNLDEIKKNQELKIKEDKKLNSALTWVNSGLVGSSEENASKILKQKFPEFDFIQQGVGTDQLLVIAPNGARTNISLDNWTDDDDRNQSVVLREFIRNNSDKELAKSAKDLSLKESQERTFLEDKKKQSLEAGALSQDWKFENGKLVIETPLDKAKKSEEFKRIQTETKAARSEYMGEKAEQFDNIYYRFKDKPLNNDEMVAAYASVKADKQEISRVNNYVNDVKNISNDVAKEKSEIEGYANSIINKLKNGEITQQEFDNVYKPEIEQKTADLNQKYKSLSTDLKNVSTVDKSINEAIGKNYLIKEATGSVIGGATSKFIKGFTYLPRLASMGEMSSEDQDEIVNLITGGGTTKEYIESEKRSDLTKALFSMSESVGILASSSLLGGSVAAYPSFYAQSYYEMKDEFDKIKGMSEKEKVLFSGAYGIVSSLLEKFGIDAAMQKTAVGKNLTNNIMKAAFSDLPKNASKEFIDAAIMNSFKKYIVKSGVQAAIGAGTEGITEALQNLSGVAIKEVYDLANETEYFNNKSAWNILGDAVYEGYLGALGGGIMSTVTSSKDIVTRGLRATLNKEQIDALINSAKVEGIDEALITNLKSSILTGKTTRAEAEEINQSFKTVKSKLESLPEDMSNEDKSVSLDLLIERDKLQKESSRLDEALRAPYNERITEINDELLKISKNAVQKQTTGEVPVQPEAKVGGEVAQGEPQAEPQVVTEEGQVAAKEEVKVFEFNGKKYEVTNESTTDLETGNLVPIDLATQIREEGTPIEETVVVEPITKQEQKQNLVTEENVEQLRAQQTTPVAQKIFTTAKLAMKALPGVKIYVHNTTNEFDQAIGQKSAEGAKGAYVDGEIHINLENGADVVTMLHESMHHGLVVKGVESGAMTDLARGLKSVISDKALKQRLDDFISNYDGSEQAEEYLAELGGIMAEAKQELTTTKFQQFKNLINKIAQKLGLPTVFSAAANAKNAVDFMNSLTKSIRTGQEIKAEEVKKTGKVKFQADFSDPLSKLTFVYDKNGEKFDQLKKDGFITDDKVLSDFAGKFIFLHQPDAAFSGMIYKDGELLVEGKGGVFYPIKFHDDGYFWASTATTAEKMAKDLNKVFDQNNGTIYMALTSAPYDKLMSSTTMSNAILDFFSSKAFDNNFKITPAQLKVALRKAANDIKIQKIKDKKTGKVKEKKIGLDLKIKAESSLDEIQAQIKTALNPDIKSFADRKNFAEELIKLMADKIKNDPKATEQFGKLFSEGIQNKYFKGISKTGKISISAANMTQAISEMFTEPLLKEDIDREKGGQVYAIVELNGKVKPEPSTKHESYPMAIESENKTNKVKIHILQDRQNWADSFIDPETGETISEDRQKKLFPTSGVSTMGLELKGKSKPKFQKTAPNGKPSNLNDKQWEQVRTPEFKKWFGDWENDPANASKVVDENGEPLVVYHGTRESFDEFSSEVRPRNFRQEAVNYSFWFTSNEKNSELYGNQVMEVFLNSRNPLEIDYTNPESYREIVVPADKPRAMSIAEFNEKKGMIKHSEMTKGIELRMREDSTIDGIIHRNIKDIILSDNFQVFGPNQIKSATENVGTFSAETRNIKFQKATTQKEAIQKAKDKYTLSVEQRGNPHQQGVDAALNDLRKSDWYKTTDDTQRENAERELKEFFGEKLKKAPSVAKILGKPKPKKVTVNEMTAYKNELRLQAKAAREAKGDLNAKRKALAAAISSMVKTGKIKTAQAGVIIKRISNLNLDNPVLVERFVDYASKVFDRADYQERLDNAFKLRKAIRKALKTDNQAEVVGMAKDFAKIDPSMVEDIDAYIAMAEKVVNAVKPSRVKGLDVVMKEAANIAEVSEYTNNEIKRQENVLKDEILAVYNSLVSDGVISKDMSLKEMQDIINYLNDPTTKMDSVEKERYIKSFLDGKLNLMKPILETIIRTKIDPFTGEELDIDNNAIELMKKVMDIDIADMSVRDAIKVVEAIDNFLNNNITSGLEAVVSNYEGVKNVNKLVNKGIKARPIKLLLNKTIGRFYSDELYSLPLLMEKLFNGVRNATKIMEMAGLSKLINGVNKANNQHNKILDDYSKQPFYSTKNFLGVYVMNKGFMDAKNVYERGMLAFLNRNLIGTEAEMKTELNRRIDMIKQSIQTLIENGDSKEVKMGEMYQEIFDKLNVNEGDIDVINSSASKSNREAVNWWINQWAKSYKELSDISLSVYNTQLGSDLNYTPDRYKKLSGESVQFDSDLIERNGAFSISIDYTDKNKTGVLMETTRPKVIPDDRYVSLDFDTNNSNSLQAALVDINTASAIRQVDGFVNSKGFKKLFTESDDRVLITRRINNYIRRAKGKKIAPRDTWDSVNKVTNFITSIGVGKALGGLNQAVMQTVPVIANTVINAGRFITVNSEMNDWINKTGAPISNRGLESQSTVESIDSRIDKKGETFDNALKNVAKLNQWYLKQFLSKPDVWVARSSFISYYLQDLKNRGISTDIDWTTHEADMDAVNYAQMMVDRQQNISDPMLAGEFLASEDSFRKIARKVVLPFASFILNQKARMYNDITTLYSKTSTTEDKITAARSLGGLSVELATYQLIGFGIRRLYDIIAASLMGDDEDEEAKKKKMINATKYPIKSIVNDIVSPLPITDDLVTYGLNKALAEIPMLDEADIKKAVEDKNKALVLNGKEEMNDREKEAFIENLKKESEYQVFTDDFAGRKYGMIGIAGDTYKELIDISKLATTGEFEDEYQGRVTKKYLNEKDRKIVGYTIAPMVLYSMGVLPKDVGQISRNVVNRVKKRGITENQYNRITDVEKEIGRKVSGWESDLIKQKKEASTAIDELDFIDRNGGLTESQGKEYVKLLKTISQPTLSDIDRIKAGQTANQILK